VFVEFDKEKDSPTDSFFIKIIFNQWESIYIEASKASPMGTTFPSKK
jgi:hypothetical protein